MGFLKTAVVIAATAILVQILPLIFDQRKLPFHFDGRIEPGFENVFQTFKKNFESGRDSEGSAFAACHNGKMVVDVWGGYADSESHAQWKENTLSIAYSMTKSVSALCVALLVDRGFIKYEDLVTKYWPEFGKHGKQNATVKMLVSHEVGLVALDEPITFESIRDWKQMSKMLENQKPNWPVGTSAGYHTLTYGFLLDQLIRRADPKQRSLGTFFRQEVAEPFEIDFHIGLPLDEEYRVARLVRPPSKEYLRLLFDPIMLRFGFKMFTQPSDSILARSSNNPDWLEGTHGENVFNDPELHSLEFGGAGGIGNARSLAKLYCLLDSGKLLNKTVLDKLLVPVRTDYEEETFHMVFSEGWGFFHTKNANGKYQIGHAGYGGQYVKYDPQYKLSIAYIRNGLTMRLVDQLNSEAFHELEKATFDSIKKP